MCCRPSRRHIKVTILVEMLYVPDDVVPSLCADRMNHNIELNYTPNRFHLLYGHNSSMHFDYLELLVIADHFHHLNYFYAILDIRLNLNKIGIKNNN